MHNHYSDVIKIRALTLAILFLEREKNNKIKLDFRWKQTDIKQPKNSAKQKNKQNQRETQRSSFIAEAINANYFSNLKQRMNEPKWMEKKSFAKEVVRMRQVKILTQFVDGGH